MNKYEEKEQNIEPGTIPKGNIFVSVALSESVNTWMGRGRNEKRRVEDRSRMSDFLFYISLDRVRPEKRCATSSAIVTSRNNKIARSVHPSRIFPPPFYTGHPLVRLIAHPRPRKVFQVAPPRRIFPAANPIPRAR